MRELVGALPAYPDARPAPPDPVREYALVLLTAAVVTFLTTPVVRMLAIRSRMMAAPRERDVHSIPTPRRGGVAMYLGVVAAVFVASQLPALQRPSTTRQTFAVLIAGGIICAARRAGRPLGPRRPDEAHRPDRRRGRDGAAGRAAAFLFLPVADIGTISLGPTSACR